MKTKKLMITALAALFIVVLAVNGFAAGGSQSGSGTSGGSGGLVMLDVYCGPSNTSGVLANNYWTDILKEDVGIQINLRPHDRDVYLAMMASGDLADVVMVHDYGQTIDMIKAGLLLNLDEHKAKLPNVYANIPTAIQYTRDNVSNGTGILYSLPSAVTSRPQQVGTLNTGPYLRWDLYKEQGMPALTEIEDYLPLLKKIVDAHPVNEAGQRVYGLSGFSDWDTNNIGPYMMLADFSGYFGGAQNQYIEMDYINNYCKIYT
jgi:putative aldouronate transport system substrate-binding protein